MGLDAQHHRERRTAALWADSESLDLASRVELAGYVVSCWGATLRGVLLTLLPLAALTTVAFTVAMFVAPDALLPLAVLAAGSAGIGLFVYFRTPRSALAKDGADTGGCDEQADRDSRRGLVGQHS